MADTADSTPRPTTPREGAAPGANAPASHPPAASVAKVPDSIREFMTDGTLPALCDELSRLTGIPVWLRDRTGEAVVPAPGDQPWQIVPHEQGAARAAGVAGGESGPVSLLDGSRRASPIRVGPGPIGELVMHIPAGADEREAGVLGRAIRLLGDHVTETCEARSALQLRVRELHALLTMSSVMAGARSDDDLLESSLELAISTLGADAGSVATIDEETAGSNDVGENLVLRAWRGLSDEWIENRRREPFADELTRRALAGEVVRLDDLAQDPTGPDPAGAAREGLHGFLCVGLLDHGRPVGLLRLYARRSRRFTRAESGLLRALGEQLSAGLANSRLRRLREEDERMQRQIRLAGAVQRRMLPVRMPATPRFDIDARYVPSFELGGDFYDFIDLGGHLGLAVGDVVGKGVPAALLMSAVRAALRAHAQDVYDIGEVLRRVNVALTDDTLDNEFATLWYGVADPFTLALTHCSAGHEWPVVIRVPKGQTPSEEHVNRLVTEGMVLGIDRAQRYTAGRFQLVPGDVLLAYTDGLPDALDFQGRRFGGKRVRRAALNLLTQEPDAPASRVIEHVFWELRQFIGLNQRLDDMTMIVMRVREPK